MEEQVSIDKLEDQLIDHPDANTKQDTEISLDESFQKKLNERAEQLNQQFDLSIQIVNQSELCYTYEDHGSLSQEISEWFSSNDFKVLGLSELATKYESRMNEYKHTIEVEYLEQCIKDINSETLDSLVYYIFGKYKDCKTEAEQLNSIKIHCEQLMNLEILPTIISFLTRCIDNQLETELTPGESTDYFKGLTIFYFCINYVITQNDSPIYIETRKTLDETDFISKIMDVVEHWKLNPSNSLKIRYLILVLWKLILLEFGDAKLLASCDELLMSHHNIQNKKIGGRKITCSPLDYYTFREDLADKYPLFNEKLDLNDFPVLKNTLQEDLDKPNSIKNGFGSDQNGSNNIENEITDITQDYNYFMALNSQTSSLSKYLANPRPNKSHSVQSQLPSATIHIATPVPSPPSTASDFMTGGEKIRKSYQVNQGMPFIYPNNEVEVPYAIKEANDILVSSIYNSYSNKRMWNERQRFMIQERGYINEYEVKPNDEFQYDESLISKYPHKELEIRSMIRVEKFYKNNLDKLNNLVSLLLETIKSCTYDNKLDFIEKQLNGTNNFFDNTKVAEREKLGKVNKLLIQQLEVMNIREITMKACSAISILILKWFKISHVLKYYYFSSLLIDHHLCQITADFLNCSFNNPSLRDSKEGETDSFLYQNKLMNPPIYLPGLEFFNNCRGKNIKSTKYELINKLKIGDFPHTFEDGVKKIKINNYNSNYCFTLVNLLNVLNKTIIKNHFQRIYTFNELKPTEVLKMIVVNYNCKAISTPIFKILKKLVPYQGRKWKTNNMDLISLIYLNCDLSMRDNWLSGRDLENDFNNAFDQEISLRALLQFYHMRNYPDKMFNLGYEIPKDFVSLPLDDHFDYL